jgi:hypothetical protein
MKRLEQKLQRYPGHDLPIFEDCDSKFGIGLEDVAQAASNPEQTKDFQGRKCSREEF